jgi:hypothetical protein
MVLLSAKMRRGRKGTLSTAHPHAHTARTPFKVLLPFPLAPLLLLFLLPRQFGFTALLFFLTLTLLLLGLTLLLGGLPCCPFPLHLQVVKVHLASLQIPPEKFVDFFHLGD